MCIFNIKSTLLAVFIKIYLDLKTFKKIIQMCIFNMKFTLLAVFIKIYLFKKLNVVNKALFI